MKLLRRLLMMVVLLLAVLLAAAVLLPRLVDSDALRSMLIVAVRNHTGRELTVEGDVRFSLVPRPAVVLPQLSLGDAAGFGPEPFASLDGARLNLRLWPLLWRRLEVASVRVDRPHLRLKMDASGRSNWADLLPEAAASGPSADAGARPSLAGRIGVRQVVLRDADLLWSDQRSGRWARLRDLDLDLGGLDPGLPIPVTATATLDVGDPQRSMQLDVATTLQRGVDGVWQGPDLRVAAELDGAPLRDVLALHLTAAASFDPAQTRLRLQQLALDAKPLQLRGELTAARSDDAPVLGAQLRLERLDARALAAQLGKPLTLADPVALSSISGNLELSADARQINLARIDLQVDGSAWRGTARMSIPDKPVVRFALEGDHLDLDRYLPADQAPDAQSAVVKPSASAPAPAPAVAGSPAEALRRLTKLDLDGTLNLATLRVRGLVLEGVALRARAGDGRLMLEPVNTSLYGGALDASLQAEARGREPTLHLKLAATDVAAGPLLTALTGRDAVQGRFTLAGEMTGAAATGDALLRSLNGTLRLNGSDGVLKGINADRSICQARALIAKARDKEAGDCDPSPDTRFSALRMGGPLTAGVWRSDDLFLEQQRYRPGRFYRLTGAGTLDLATGKADYLLNATAVRRGGEAADPEIREAMVPVRVRGRPGEWHLKPELDDGMRDEALRKLQDKLDPGDNDGRESRGKSLLRGLFGR